MSNIYNIDLWYTIRTFVKTLDNQHTRRSYQSQLIKYIGWLVEQGHKPTLSSLTAPFVAQYRDYELHRGAAPATVALNIKALKRFDKWLSEEIDWQPQLLKVKIPVIAQPEFKGISEELRQEIIHNALNSARDFDSLRLATLLYCYAGLGLRRIEPLQINSEQLDLQRGLIKNVRMKGGIYRDKVIPSAHVSLFDDYAIARRRLTTTLGVRGKLPLLISYRGNRVSGVNPRTAARWVEPLGVAPHEIRHSYAQALLKSTGDIRIVAYELGQNNIQTALIYTVPSAEYRQQYHATLNGGR